MTIVRLLFLAFFLGTAVLAVWAGQREYSYFLVSKTPLSDDLRNTPTYTALPLSKRGRTDILLRCSDGLSGLDVRLLPKASQNRLAQSCRTLAEQVLESNPTRALAHFTRATAAEKVGDFANMEEALILAHATAPREGWLADRRMQLALPYEKQLSAHARDALVQDVTLLLQFWGLRDVVVAQYLRDESTQDFLISIVETQSPEIQRAFFASIRRGLGT